MSSIEDGLILSNQSEYKPGSSCINQLLSIAHDIFKSLDCGCDVKGVFLTIGKLLTRLSTMMSSLYWKQNGTSDNLRMILQDYLDEQKKRVVLNGQVFMGQLAAGVPLVQFLVQYSFSYTLMIYQKVSIVATHPLPQKLAKKRGGQIFYKNRGLEKRVRFSRTRKMPDFLLS